MELSDVNVNAEHIAYQSTEMSHHTTTDQQITHPRPSVFVPDFSKQLAHDTCNDLPRNTSEQLSSQSSSTQQYTTYQYLGSSIENVRSMTENLSATAEPIPAIYPATRNIPYIHRQISKPLPSLSTSFFSNTANDHNKINTIGDYRQQHREVYCLENRMHLNDKLAINDSSNLRVDMPQVAPHSAADTTMSNTTKPPTTITLSSTNISSEVVPVKMMSVLPKKRHKMRVQKQHHLYDEDTSTAHDGQRDNHARNILLETALCRWILDVRITDCIITDDILFEKARQLCDQMNITDFQWTDEWLFQFKNKCGIPKDTYIEVISDKEIQQRELPVTEQDLKSDIGRYSDISYGLDPMEKLSHRPVEGICALSDQSGVLVEQTTSDIAKTDEEDIKYAEMLPSEIFQTCPEAIPVVNIDMRDAVRMENMNRLINNPCSITADEAKQGLTNCITYLEAHHTLVNGQDIKTLKKVLRQLSKYVYKLEKRKKAKQIKRKPILRVHDTQDDIINDDPEIKKIMSKSREFEVHPDNPNKCIKCGKILSNSSNLRAHMRLHDGERPYLCNICGSSFTQMGNLQTHQSIHTGKKPHVCPVCDKSFARPGYLKSHMTTHTSDRPYMCSTCGKSFQRNSDLQLHTRVHTGYKPYKCSYCSKDFRRLGCLKDHTRTHTGDKPYKCTKCGQAFSQKSVLSKHIRIHTGEKPFICSVCGKSFSQSGTLYHHGKTHNTRDKSANQKGILPINSQPYDLSSGIQD